MIQYTKVITDFCNIDEEMFNILNVFKTNKFTEILRIDNKLVLNLDNSNENKYRSKILLKGFNKNLGVKIAS